MRNTDGARTGTDQYRNSIVRTFSAPSPDSVGVYKSIQEVYPAFAKKIFQNNKFMEKLVMSGMNPMYILDYPICGRCETLAAYDGFAKKNGRLVNACSCFADGCGHRTIDPITFKEWLKYELKKKAPADFVEVLEYAVDAVALTMMKKYLHDSHDLFMNANKEQKRRLGFVDSFGNPIMQEEHHKVTLEEVNGSVDLQEEMAKIGREENTDVFEANE